MPDSVPFGGGNEFTSTGHEGKETLISAGALKGNRKPKNWTVYMMQCVFVCLEESVWRRSEGGCSSAAISQDNSLQSVFVIAVKVCCTLILALPECNSGKMSGPPGGPACRLTTGQN